MEISKKISYVLRGIKRAISRKWLKFLTAGYLVFWKQFPAAGYLDTSFFNQVYHVLGTPYPFQQTK